MDEFIELIEIHLYSDDHKINTNIIQINPEFISLIKAFEYKDASTGITTNNIGSMVFIGGQSHGYMVKESMNEISRMINAIRT